MHNHSNYRLAFIERLAAPPPPKVFVADTMQAQLAYSQRVMQQYHRLLLKEDIKFTMVGHDELAFDTPMAPELLARIWNDAMLLVQVGRDLH